MVNGQSTVDNQSIESMVVRGCKTRQETRSDQETGQETGRDRRNGTIDTLDTFVSVFVLYYTVHRTDTVLTVYTASLKIRIFTFPFHLAMTKVYYGKRLKPSLTSPNGLKWPPSLPFPSFPSFLLPIVRSLMPVPLAHAVSSDDRRSSAAPPFSPMDHVHPFIPVLSNN